MMKFRYLGALFALTGVLFAFLIAGTLLITWQQQVTLTATAHADMSAELNLMGEAFYESLLKSDYVTIRTFIERWGEVHPEFLLIRATAPNGFIIGEFRRAPASDAPTIDMDKTITLDGKPLLSISLTADLSKTDAVVTRIRNQLIAGSVLFTAILGVVLWRSQRSLAMAPLEREIELRQRAEEGLQHARDALEITVQERTADLQKELVVRKQVEQELVQREKRIHLLLTSAAEGIYGVDVKGSCTFCNPSALRMLGYKNESQVFGKNTHALFHHKRSDGSPYPVEDCGIYDAYQTGRGFHNDHEIFWRKDGTSFPVEYWSYPIKDDDGVPLGAVVTFIDITDRKRLESQLVQAQKMEAIGTLAGGVAHDFNNILTAIMGYSGILQRKMDNEDPLKINVSHILESAQRAARLTQNLLAFSRKQVMTPQPVDLNSITRRVDKLLRRLIGEDIEIAMDLCDADLIVLADSSQIEQVLMNLATNARDAMPDGGCFTVRSEKTDFDAEAARLNGLPGPGDYGVLSVSDTGIGMDEKTRLNIFEPFFTTKEVGRGTGLGMSIVYGIIKQHNGTITVYSEGGKGSTFKIYLPLLHRETAAGELRHPEITVRGGSETILIAEDDLTVRTLMRTILEDGGYRILEAADGEEAVCVFAEHRDKIQLVLLDTIMPKKNGRQAYETMKENHPDLRALFMSGYTADVVSKQGLLEPGFDLLQKPVAPDDLLFRVRRALDA